MKLKPEVSEGFDIELLGECDTVIAMVCAVLGWDIPRAPRAPQPPPARADVGAGTGGCGAGSISSCSDNTGSETAVKIEAATPPTTAAKSIPAAAPAAAPAATSSLWMPLPDYDELYTVLGCAESSSQEQITAEYRKRSLKVHPDKAAARPSTADAPADRRGGGGSVSGESAPRNARAGDDEHAAAAAAAQPAATGDVRDGWNKLRAAYQVLSDPTSRALYDRWRRSGLVVTFAEWSGRMKKASAGAGMHFAPKSTKPRHQAIGHHTNANITTPSTDNLGGGGGSSSSSRHGSSAVSVQDSFRSGGHSSALAAFRAGNPL